MIGIFYDIEGQTSMLLLQNIQAETNTDLAQALQVRPLRPVLLLDQNCSQMLSA